MRTLAFVALVVFAGTGGELAVTHAMKEIGEVKDFAPRAVLGILGRALLLGWMWIGIALLTLSFFCFLALLSWEDVSFVVPVTALSYVVGALGAKFFLGERVTPVRWAGVLLVCLGVALVWAG